MVRQWKRFSGSVNGNIIKICCFCKNETKLENYPYLAALKVNKKYSL